MAGAVDLLSRLLFPERLMAPSTTSKHFARNIMTNEVNSVDPTTDSAIVTSLLSRQDEVIEELDLLEAQIMSVIEDLSAQRQTADQIEDADHQENESTVLPMGTAPTATTSGESQSLPKAA